MKLPEPIPVPWTMKPLGSAETRIEHLDDGRVRFSIVHDVLAGVTPEMLVWWFEHMDGDVEIGGRQVPRYRAWHPRDHVALRYLHPSTDGRRFGPGARVHIQEFLGGDPRYAVDFASTVDFLDATGFAHGEWVAGRRVAHLQYRFVPVAGGTRYEDSLTVGIESGMFGAMFNRLVRPAYFSEDMGRAWLLHNVEEVGNLQFFLPDLYRAHA